jgi:putative transposase
MQRIQSWEASDELWQRVEPFIAPPTRDPQRKYLRKAGAGRKPIAYRTVFEAIVYVLRTGCQWKALPKEQFGSASAIHTSFLKWARVDLFSKLWEAGLTDYDELKGIAWDWQSIDGTMTKAPLAQESVGQNPTNRGKMGTKRHILVDGRGTPLAIVTTGANRHDVSQMDRVLDSIVISRPEPTPESSQHLCADKAFDSKDAREAMKQRRYTPHVRSRGEERLEKCSHPSYRARRWVVEACHSWMNRFRKILVRFEKTDLSYLALVHLACAIIAWRKATPIYG